MRDPLPPPAIALDTRVPAEPAAPGGTPTAIDEGRGLGPAIRFVLGTPAILVITLMYMAVNVGEGMFTVLAPVYARDVLGGGAVVYGLIVSAFTGGSLAGSLIVGAVDWPFPLGRSIAGALVLTGAAFLPMLVRPPLAITFVILVLAGLFASSLTTWAQTIRMRLIPLTLRGRVFALLRTLMQGTTPVGAFAGGWMLAAGAVAPVVAAIAAIVAVPGAIGLVSPALGREATGEPV
jgi:MFS family permease